MQYYKFIVLLYFLFTQRDTWQKHLNWIWFILNDVKNWKHVVCTCKTEIRLATGILSTPSELTQTWTHPNYWSINLSNCHMQYCNTATTSLNRDSFPDINIRESKQGVDWVGLRINKRLIWNCMRTPFITCTDIINVDDITMHATQPCPSQ